MVLMSQNASENHSAARARIANMNERTVLLQSTERHIGLHSECIAGNDALLRAMHDGDKTVETRSKTGS
jgi:hypothetical protein